MSAQIPDTMLLSDLLKATGYDCPEELQGKTFEEATTGGDAKISTNTAKTIDVSAYTEPVVVEPAEGYDATKKVTVTLDNIPPGKLFAYGTAEGAVYLQFLPEGDIENLAVLVPSTTGIDSAIGTYTEEGDKVTIGSTDYARYTAGDIEL